MHVRNIVKVSLSILPRKGSNLWYEMVGFQFLRTTMAGIDDMS
jgi:hypothetical protein